jgi:hypothetical protein
MPVSVAEALCPGGGQHVQAWAGWPSRDRQAAGRFDLRGLTAHRASTINKIENNASER